MEEKTLMKKTSAVFLDRDGTIIEDMGYLSDPKDVIFFDNTVKALKILAARFALFIVTNQAGISEGFITGRDVERVNGFIVDYLGSAGIKILNSYYCPHSHQDGCSCRKPSPYYLHKAENEYNIDLSSSFVIGDHPCDVEMAQRAGASGIFILTGHGEKHADEIAPSVTVAKDIMDAALVIEGKRLKGKTNPTN